MATPFAAGASCYAYYTMQPYLLELFGNPETYSIAAIGATGSFWVVVVVLVIWAIVFAAVVPIQQASLNGIMPSEQRVTVLSFISLMGSSGAVFSQPALGRVADPWGYSVSYFVTVMVQLGALPYLIIGGTIR